MQWNAADKEIRFAKKENKVEMQSHIMRFTMQVLEIQFWSKRNTVNSEIHLKENKVDGGCSHV